MLRGPLGGSPGESRYPTPISENLPDNSALVGALQDSEEEEEDEEFNLLHTSESSEHVVSQGITMSSIQSSIHVNITQTTEKESKKQEEQKEAVRVPSNSQKKIVSASTRVIRSSKFNVRSDYKKLNDDTSTHRVSVLLAESKVLIPKFRFGKTAKSHVHMMRVLHALTSGETLGLGLAHEESRIYKKVRASSD